MDGKSGSEHSGGFDNPVLSCLSSPIIGRLQGRCHALHIKLLKSFKVHQCFCFDGYKVDSDNGNS